MRRKRVYLIIAVICGITAISSVFAAARTDEDIVKGLIRERTDVLSGFYAGEVDKSEAIETVNLIETGHLLEEDIQNIELYFRTDIEQVRGYSFDDITVTKSEEGLICAQVTMTWEDEGIGGKDRFTLTYDVICVQEGSSYKMAQFF